jgi:DNA-binding transcriptional ArsR family regulator
MESGDFNQQTLMSYICSDSVEAKIIDFLMLRWNDVNVSTVSGNIGISKATIYPKIAQLTDKGLLDVRFQGKMALFKLNDEVKRKLGIFMEGMNEYFENEQWKQNEEFERFREKFKKHLE